MDVTVLGVPFNGDGTPPEMENPAQALRDAGLVSRLTERGYRVTDLGDLAMPVFSGRRDGATGVLNQEAWRQMTESLGSALRSRLDPRRPVVLLGGDCAILSGVVAARGAADPPLGIVYVDGHADYRWPADSPTGEPADVVLPALTGRIPGLFDDSFPFAPEDDVVVLGSRDPDRIAESRIATYDHARIRQLGLSQVVEDALGRIAERRGPAWVHFDVDVLDPSVMPAVVSPEGDGLAVDEAEVLLRAAFRALPVLGMSVACYHPQLDPDGRAARTVAELVSVALAG